MIRQSKILRIDFIYRCSGAVFEAEKLTVKDEVYHKRCFTCHRCSRALDSLSVSASPDGDIYCKVFPLKVSCHVTI